MLAPRLITAASTVVAVSLAVAAYATNYAQDAPDIAAESQVERKVFNERLWPKEASRLVRTSADPKTCLETADTVFVVNNEESFIVMNDGDFYLSKLQRRCNNVLVNGATISSAFGRRQICEGHTVVLPDRFGGVPNAQCFLGAFEPLRLAQTGDTDVIVVNEGQTIRRPR